MALQEKRVCDVFGTQQKVQTWEIVVRDISTPSLPADPLFICTLDLGPPAQRRLLRYLNRATTPPPPRQIQQQDGLRPGP